MPTMQHVIGELPHKRTKNAKHYLLSDGSFQAVIFMHDVHYEDENGNLQNIDTDLYDEADFDVMEFPVSKHKCDSFRARRQMVIGAKNKGVLDREKFDFHAIRVPFAATIPRNFRKGYSIGKGENKLTFKPVGASVSIGRLNPEKRSEVEYQDAWNDVDVKLELTERGVKETLILKTDKAPSEFSFEVEGELADDLTAGELLLENAWLEDAAGTRRDVQQTVRRECGKVYVDLSVEVTGLTFPVVVDPTTTLQPSSKDNYVRTVNGSGGTVNGSLTNLLVEEYFQSALNFVDSWINIAFDMSSIPANAAVNSATLQLYLNSYTFTGATKIYIYTFRAPNAWTETQDPGQDSSVSTQTEITNTTPTSQYFNIDVTAVERYIRNNGYTHQGYSLSINNAYNGSTPLPWDAQRDIKINFNSRESSTNRPKLSLTYTVPPSAPTVTAPNGGETWNAQHTITWTPATDPDTAQANLQYHIQLSTDNGGTWKDIVALTAAGATSYTYDFSNETETSVAKIRIRAYDGANYGPWDESNGVFTIMHNRAPNAPTNLSPSGGAPVDRAGVVRLSWQHNDPNSNDPQSKFDLQWRPVGNTTWNTVTQATPNQYWDAPAGTFPRGNIEWQVRTYDQAGLSGPYSAQATFFAGDKPSTPTIVSPSNGSTVGVARPTLQWSSADQQKYQAQILSIADAVLWDTGEVNSTNKAITLGYDLANNTQYKLRVRILNSDGLWSDWTTVTVTVSYTPPFQPLVSVVPDNTNARNRVIVTNPFNGWVNLLGTDGNCEDTSKLSFFGGTAALDDTRKTQGNSSIKMTKTAAATYVDPQSLRSIYPAVGECYIVIADVYLENSASGLYISHGASGVAISSKFVTGQLAGFVVSTTGVFVPVIRAFEITSVITPGVSYLYPRIYHNGTSGRAYNVDSFRVYKITKEEYDALPTNVNLATAQAIAAQYPYLDPTTNPTVVSNEIFRRKAGETSWQRIAQGIAPNSVYDDYTVASGVEYEYKVKANGNNGTYAESDVSAGKVTFSGVWLHCVDDPAGTIHRFALSSGNSDEWRTDGALLRFAGRERPVAEFGETDEGRITVNLQMLKNRGDREALQKIIRRKTTVCYRDNRGRKLFGVVFQLPSTDTFYGYTVTISVDEIDYKEEV